MHAAILAVIFVSVLDDKFCTFLHFHSTSSTSPYGCLLQLAKI